MLCGVLFEVTLARINSKEEERKKDVSGHDSNDKREQINTVVRTLLDVKKLLWQAMRLERWPNYKNSEGTGASCSRSA